jgi:hypothetical protein
MDPLIIKFVNKLLWVAICVMMFALVLGKFTCH